MPFSVSSYTYDYIAESVFRPASNARCYGNNYSTSSEHLPCRGSFEDETSVVIGCNFRRAFLRHWSKLRRHITTSSLRVTGHRAPAPLILYPKSSMPAKRTRSCYGCRVAKAKCSLEMPCLRCATRHLLCEYTPNQPLYNGSRRMRRIKPAKDVSVPVDSLGSTSLATPEALPFAANVSWRNPVLYVGVVLTSTHSYHI
jgi:hypothetical protein